MAPCLKGQYKFRIHFVLSLQQIWNQAFLYGAWFLLGSVFRSQDLGAMCAFCWGGVPVSRLLHWTELGSKCKKKVSSYCYAPIPIHLPMVLPHFSLIPYLHLPFPTLKAWISNRKCVFIHLLYATCNTHRRVSEFQFRGHCQQESTSKGHDFLQFFFITRRCLFRVYNQSPVAHLLEFTSSVLC